MYFNRKCKITYIAHGATIYSEEGRFSDANNYPPLSEAGISEIQNINKFLKYRGVKNDQIYTSPTVKAMQSASLISKLFKQDYCVLEDLVSRKCGELNGLTYSDILEKDGKILDSYYGISEKFAIKNAEEPKEFINRVGKSINNLIENNIGNRIIVVTQPDVIQAVICSALEIPACKLPKIFIRTGSATQISYYEEWASLVYSDNVPIFE